MRVLGFDTVFNMAIGLAIGGTLNLPKSEVSGASPYWLDAVYTAATAEALACQADKAHRPNPGTAYLTGLLSNFGTLVLGHVFPPQYATICRIQEANPKIHHSHIDLHVLSLNREIVAATLMELWEVPEEVTTAVRFQHVSDYLGEHQAYVNLLVLARTLLKEAMSEEFESLDLKPDWLDKAQQLNIDEPGLREVLTTIRRSKEDLGALAQLMVS